ncbi:MAG: PKD domain-containing protein [Thermoplasmata archaeon]|nr:PKD domain-containing protein [Thermoplasmata archaeon]
MSDGGGSARRGPAARLAAVVGLVALLVVPGLVGLATAPGSVPTPGASSSAPTLSPRVSSSLSGTAAPVPPLSVSCPLGFPTYHPVGDGWPLSPSQVYQTPCPPVGHDQVHASFFSAVSGSGERFTESVYLPTAGGGPFAQGDSFSALYVGMVVHGDPRSEWNQSYAQVVFAPISGGAKYSENLTIWSLVNLSKLTVPCPGLNLSWNNSYFCEVDDVAHGAGTTLTSALTGGSWVTVTFDGNVSATDGVRVWVNDSATPFVNETLRLNVSTTGNYTFEPYFRSACPNACVLNWSVQFGTGIGFDLCPTVLTAGGPCNSYNETTLRHLPAASFGPPEYFANGSYRSDYRYFAPESTSGACTTQAPPGTVASCVDFSPPLGGSSYYPFFTFNGSSVSFGTNASWTTHDWGQALGQFATTAVQTDLGPLFLDSVTNSSRAGFVGPGLPINVSAGLELWGAGLTATLHFRVNTMPWSTLPMTLVGGPGPSGRYNATIPGAGGDGTVAEWVSATDGTGATVRSANATVVRGVLPQFQLHLLTVPAGCGGIRFNGTTDGSGSVVSVGPGTYPVSASPCYPYAFSVWNATPGLRLSPGPGTSRGTLSVSANGTLTGVWRYVRPLDTVTLLTSPASCGTITLNGTQYTNGAMVGLLDQLNFSLSATACGGALFAGWHVVGPLDILGANIEPRGNGTLTATFVAATSAFSLTFHTTPATCGGVGFNGAGYTDGESLGVLGGTYPIAPEPCAHYGLLDWAPTGGMTVSGRNLTVTSAGSLTEDNLRLTEVTIATFPATCGTVTFDSVAYVNGAVVVVSNHTLHLAAGNPCAGRYLFALTANGSVTVQGNVVSVDGPGTLLATFLSGTPQAFVGFLTDPRYCGAIDFGGTTYTDSNFTRVAPGTVWSVAPASCANYGFVRWTVTGSISLVGALAYVNGSGSITAVYRPLVPVFLATAPATCGTVRLDGVAYPDGTTVSVPIDRSYLLSAVPCAFHALAGWVNSSAAWLGPATVTFFGSAILTADFSPIPYAVAVQLGPGSCGSVAVGAAVAASDTVLDLVAQSYRFQALPCTGWTEVGATTAGNLSLLAGLLNVTGAGTLTVTFGPVPPSLRLSVPASAFVGIIVPFTAAVAYPLALPGYAYTWSFGDGSAAVHTPVNFTSHTYATAGTFRATVTVLDPYNRTATDTLTVTVIVPPGGGAFGGLSRGIEVVLGIVAATGAAVGVGTLFLRRSHRGGAVAPTSPPET